MTQESGIGVRLRRLAQRLWSDAEEDAQADHASNPFNPVTSIEEEAVRSSRSLSLLHDVIDAFPDPVLVVTPDYRVVIANREALNRADLKRDLPLGLKCHRISHASDSVCDEEHHPCPVRHVLATGEPTCHTHQHTHADGSVSTVEVRGVPIFDDEGRVAQVIEVCRDVTARVRAEEGLRSTLAAAEAANRAKTDFLARMSHEIRTPMNGILGMTQLVLDTPLTAAQEEYLNALRRSAEALLGTLSNLLEYSAIDRGRLALESIEFDLKRSVEDVLAPLRARATAKGIDLCLEIRPDIMPSLVGDPVRLGHLIDHLVRNSVKFTQQGRIDVSLDVEIVGARAVIQGRIRDTGIGIEPEALATIFEPFEQADGSATRRHDGAGLGLAISRQLASLMGGRVWAESRPGKGSIFNFEIHLRVAAQRAQRADGVSGPESRARLGGAS